MAGRTLMQLAELTLKRHYGGQLRTSDQKITHQQVMLHLIQARDTLMKRELQKKENKNIPPDDVWFTRYEEVPVEWNTSRKVNYVVLPDGYVPLRHDMGVRVMPMVGFENNFRRIPSGWASNRREYSYAEGTWLWEVSPSTVAGDKIVEFPLTRKGFCKEVMLDVISESSTPEPDDPLRMPSDYEDTVIRMTLEILGFNRQSDEANDNVDQV